MEVAEAKRVDASPTASHAPTTSEATLGETAATLGALMAGRGMAGLTGGPAQRALLALQRTTGNRAVAALAGA